MGHDEYPELFNYLQAEFKNINAQIDQIATKLELNRLAVKIKTPLIQSGADVKLIA